MDFSDFGVKDESELEQDDFSLSRPTFGKDNQLTVIGWKGYTYSAKNYMLKCSECAKDYELHGDGVFKQSRSSLTKGSISCGCSKGFVWSEDQYKILIERKCKEKGYFFYGFVEDFKGSKSKLKLGCSAHGCWETSNINNFFRGRSCPSCQNVLSSKRMIKEDTSIIQHFVSTGKFKEGTKFWRSERVNNLGRLSYWKYTCPVCSNDEYVKAGLCSGVFESTRSSFAEGGLACRCSSRYLWSKSQYEYKIKKKMSEYKTTDEFVGFVGEFKNKDSQFLRKCTSHGEYATSINNYIAHQHGCPECANRNQQEAYINLIKRGVFNIALKFGIAKFSENRHKQQNGKSKLDIEQYGVWSFPDVKSCKAAERHIKKHLPCRFLTKQEMPDGFTETTSVENLEAIIKIYEDFGGVRKIISNKEQFIENNKNKEAA